jgi:hypothetical protein
MRSVKLFAQVKCARSVDKFLEPRVQHEILQKMAQTNFSDIHRHLWHLCRSLDYRPS